MYSIRSGVVSCAVAAGLGLLGASFAFATPLTGSGSNLPIPAPNPGEPSRQAAALSSITAAGFDGTWTAPALTPWHGTFNASGPVPASNAYPAGITNYGFATLTAGYLPVGTYFFFGDVDGGSTQNETFVLKAYDVGGTLITTPWLDEPIGVTGTGTGSGGTILPGNLPGWSWTPASGEYLIDGTTVSGGNSSVGAFLPSNTAISRLYVERTSAYANFGLSAPIPEPNTALLLLIGGAAMLRRGR